MTHPRTHRSPGVFTLLLAAFVGIAVSRARRRTTPLRKPRRHQASYAFKVNSDIVLTNIVVRDKKTGQIVPGLKPSDFTVLENGKAQHILSLDFQNVDVCRGNAKGS